jgi:hypothetical protein
MAAGSGLTATADNLAAITFVAKTGGFSTGSPATSTGANWVSLYTNQGTAASKAPSSEWTSASDTSYARQAMGAAGAGWTIGAYVSATGVAFNNNAQVQFPAVSGNAQTLNCVGFCDAITAGNIILFSDTSTANIGVALGVNVQFNATTDIVFTVY